MATRTYLTQDDMDEAKKVLHPPLTKPSGQVHLDQSFSTLDFSSWLGLTIEKRLRDISGWEEAHPIAIGSWGRGELCPGSDLDVLFCGEEKAVSQVIDKITPLGIKFRYRMPEDPTDWSKGVDVLESNALFWAKPFTHRGATLLQEQKAQILNNEKAFRRELLTAIMGERKRRLKRYDSIANFLEPNLKFGKGGLRDLHQALILAHWFPDKVSSESHAFEVLDYYKKFFLIIRQKLHLNNNHDILVNVEQPDLASWFGYEKNLDFMREVQKGLSRVSFYSDWVSERCRTPLKQLHKREELKIQSFRDCFKLIEKDTSIQAQAQVRQALFDNRGFKNERMTSSLLGKFLRKGMGIDRKDNEVVALFRSQLISHSLPNYTKTIGLVQHDQYHRFSVDAHLLQAVREVRRIYDHPKLLGKLSYYCEKLKDRDWEILRWAALYHDIAKGRGGAHEKKGKTFTIKDLSDLGFPKTFVQEVAWMVEQHLVMSTAAFRKNPRATKTWQELFDRGVKGQRIYLLALFTAIDIRATNPEAWNHWKESLLFELAETLRDPSSEKFYTLSRQVKDKKLAVSDEFLEQLDVSVIESVPAKFILGDIEKILKKEELAPLVVKDKKNQIWVRFHRNQDQSGLMFKYVQSLSGLGCNIRQASVITDDKMGVYDWFCVKTSKEVSVLKKQLLHNNSASSFKPCSFSKIDLMSEDENEWVISFRAKDKKGLLMSAIQALYDHQLEIVWAKVHTWGRQIEDIFGVLPKSGESSEQIMKKLTDQYLTEELNIL